MDPIVRVATVDDIEALDWLQLSARHAIVDVRGGQLRLSECESVADWRPIIGAEHTVVLVATLDDVVLGYMMLVMRPSKGRGVITHAYVAEGARELGLGDTMVEHAIAAVLSAGLHGIEAVALPGDRETKNLYERAGLTARKLTVYKSLTAEPG